MTEAVPVQNNQARLKTTTMEKPKDCKEKECTMVKHEGAFRWYIAPEGYRVMPCLESANVRVNHCPTCGLYVRDINQDKPSPQGNTN